MSGDSPLCKACEIFNICHEPQKLVSNSCQHFKGEVPNGYLRHRSSVVKFVWKKGFAGNIGYLDFPDRKEWLDNYQLNRLRRTSEGTE